MREYVKLDHYVGYTKLPVPNNVFDDIKNTADQVLRIDTNELLKRRFNDGLAGNIEHEYYIEDLVSNEFKEFILQETQEFNKANNFSFIENLSILSDNKPFFVDRVWLNCQRKNEFNPIHKHYGVYSFVIWLQVPFVRQDEINFSKHSIEPAKNTCGLFQFVMGSSTELYVHPLPVDKEWEQTMIVFPANLYHTVYPFYSSNDYRISISGNIKIKV
jgi:hypothetical protein